MHRLSSAGLRRIAFALTFAALTVACTPTAASSETAGLEVTPPVITLNGLDATISVRGSDLPPLHNRLVEIVHADSGARIASAILDAEGAAEIKLPGDQTGQPMVARLAGSRISTPISLRVIPGWLSILPPALAILLALLIRHVVPALLAGVWAGAWILYGDPLTGALRTLDRYLVSALADSDHVSIVLFTLMLGGMVGIASRAGGTQGLVDALSPWATTRKRGQLVSWFLGLAVFFDDYANTLIVGNTMRPVTDRLRISREKLAYIVDSTAAPVASIAVVTTWIGYEVSLMGDALQAAGDSRNAYTLFLRSLVYNFYPLLALLFGFAIAWSKRDFGPMLTAERRAAAGQVLAPGAMPLADFEHENLTPPKGRPRRWFNAVVPISVVLVVTFLSLWIGGRASLAADGDPVADQGLFALGIRGLGTVLGAGDSYAALLYGSMSGCIVALVLAVSQRLLSLGEGLEAWVGGIKSMMAAMVILLLAWSISHVCTDLQAPEFMVAAFSDQISPGLLPTLVFLLAAVCAFSTGSSWSTMGILIPLTVPTAIGISEHAALSGGAADRVLLAAMSAVLAGAIFGDHCSPISDTTVMSSMACGCDHIHHVRTQLPYALVVAGVAVLAGYLPAGFGLPPLLGLLLGAGLLVLLLRLIGRTAQ